jgi:hypothetical protein
MPFFKKDIIADFLSRLSIPGIKILANKELNERSLRENGVSICRGSILDSYLEEALDAAFGDNPNYEVVALFEDNVKSAPISFLIVEKGECEKMSEAWSVNLICASLQSPKGLKGVGQILMGLYLYIIAENEEVEEKTGVLELANGYINAGGLASYSKLGFIVDKSLYGEDCFPNYNNLPMIASDIDPDRIVDILNNVPNAAYNKEAVCLIGDRDIQLYAGICLNLLTFMTLVPEGIRKKHIIADYALNYGQDDVRVVDYKYLYSLIKKDPEAFETLVLNIESGTRTDSTNFPGFSKLHTKIFTKEPVAKTSASATVMAVAPIGEPLERKTRASRSAATAVSQAPAHVVKEATLQTRASRSSKRPASEEQPSRSSRRAKTTVHAQTQRKSKTQSQSKVSRQSYPVKKAKQGNPLSVIEEEISEAEESEEEAHHNPSVFYQLRSMLFPPSKKSTARGLKKRKHSKVTRRRRRKH